VSHGALPNFVVISRFFLGKETKDSANVNGAAWGYGTGGMFAPFFAHRKLC
jgi:hypothetical protein